MNGPNPRDYWVTSSGMPPESERPEDAEATRDRLIDVTIELLEQRGNHALRLADIAREAGVAVSTIYAHFRDRTDLVAAARLTQFKAHANEAIARVEMALDPSLTREDFITVAIWPTLLAPDEPDGKARRWDRLEAIADSRHLPELSRQLQEMQEGLSEQVIALIRRSQELELLDPTLDATALAMLTQVIRLGLALWDISGTAQPELEAWNEVVERVYASVQNGALRPV
ncbi:hypothetical protein BH10ACT3_BH10ACT3_01740 [soil metagenome]